MDEAARGKIEQFLMSLENEAAGKPAALTPEERVKYGSIKENNKLLVNKMRDYRQSSLGLSPLDVN